MLLLIVFLCPRQESVTNIFPDGKISRPRLTAFALPCGQTHAAFRLSLPDVCQAVGILLDHIRFTPVSSAGIEPAFPPSEGDVLSIIRRGQKNPAPVSPDNRERRESDFFLCTVRFDDTCALGRNRTCDPLDRNQMLYPLSYERNTSFATSFVQSPCDHCPPKAGPPWAEATSANEHKSHLKRLSGKQD